MASTRPHQDYIRSTIISNEFHIPTKVLAQRQKLSGKSCPRFRRTSQAPAELLLANSSQGGPCGHFRPRWSSETSSFSAGEGLLGLISSNQKAPTTWLRGSTKEDSGSSVIDALWDTNPNLPRTYRLDVSPRRGAETARNRPLFHGFPFMLHAFCGLNVAAASPRLLLGVPGSDAHEPSEVTFLGPTLTRLVDHWYVSVRAMGLYYAHAACVDLRYD